ncbi:MAG: hypothetical protein AAFY50_10255 [Cyanobacteria bacterium J06648_1]
MKKLTILLLCLTLFSCSSSSSTENQTSSIKTESLSATQKLTNRKDKWNADRKCLKAIEIKSDIINSLCANSQNIYTLAHEGGFFVAESIIENQLKTLDKYQQELKEGLRSDIPLDELEIAETREKLNEYLNMCLESIEILSDDFETQSIQNKCERMETALDTYENNYVPLP